jgi:hypothetical protein
VAASTEYNKDWQPTLEMEVNHTLHRYTRPVLSYNVILKNYRGSCHDPLSYICTSPTNRQRNCYPSTMASQ